MNKLERLSPLTTIIISFLFLLLFYSNAMLSPNNYLFCESGDAIKNYFTYASHIKENSIINSQIMNYPYGENFLYMDCQPVFTIILKFLSNIFPSIQNHVIGIINFLMVFSILASSFFIYLILIELKINRIFSSFGAFSIALLAPQIFRISGHLALSYSFFIPLTWYLFIRFSKSQFKLKWSVILFFNNLFWYFVHAYLGMIIVSFLLFCFLFDFIFFEKKKYKDLTQWFYIFSQTFFPLILFWGFAILTDEHVGRTDNPYGFLIYTSNFSSVFLPNHAPLKPFIDKIITTKQNWEGWAYIGVGSSVSILLFFFNRILKLFSKRTLVENKKLLYNRNLILAICSALVLLIISMGYPFKLKMEFLLNWFPIIKNFRGIGRFSWVFYYVITIASIYLAYSIYESNRKRPVYLFLAFLLPISYICESIPYHMEISKSIIKNYNLFDKTQLSETLLEGLQYADSSKYQAIFPLPFYDIGSENYGKQGTDKIYRISMILSYHSGIPIMGNYSTRTSIPESKKLVQLLSPNFYIKEIGNDLKSDKPFLIVYSHEEISEYERSILERCNKIYSDNDYSLYSLTKEALFKNTSMDEIHNYEKLKEQLIYNNGFLTTLQDPGSIIIYNSFEDSPKEKSFRGQGSCSGQMRTYNMLEKIEPNKLISNKEYILSFWMYNEGENYGQDALNSMAFIQTEDKVNNIEWIALTNPANSIVINGSWSLVELSFKVDDTENNISVYLKGDNNSKKNFYIDDLLIREKDNDVYKVVKKNNNQILELFKNNHRIIN